MWRHFASGGCLVHSEPGHLASQTAESKIAGRECLCGSLIFHLPTAKTFSPHLSDHVTPLSFDRSYVPAFVEAVGWS